MSFTRTRKAIGAALALALTAGCSGELVQHEDGPGGGDDSEEPPEPLCEVESKSYLGLGGEDLTEGRAELAAGSDRVRFKPLSALRGEYARTLGVPVQTGLYRGTFGPPEPRWYEEPQASADTLYASFALAYGGCLTYTEDDPRFAGAPDVATAENLCGSMIRTFTDRLPTDDQKSACATYVVGETAESDEPQVRWAYACAAVLTSADFLTY